MGSFSNARMPRWIRHCLWFALLPILTVQALPPPGDPPLQRNGYSRISSSAEISADLAAITAASDIARLEVLGHSIRRRPIEALVLRAPDGVANPLRVLIVGSQHGAAEPAGAEALLRLARELAFGELRPWLDELDVVLVPNANPDGRDLGRRTNAKGVNLNTDFVRAGEPETRALLRALARYEPDAVLDTHESAVLKRKSLGLEGWLTDFEIQFEFANNPGVPAAIREFSERELLPALLAATATDGATAHRYIGEITSTSQPITNGGLSLRNLRNTAGVQSRVSFLVETRLDSGELEYPTWHNIARREHRQLRCLRAFLQQVRHFRQQIQAAISQPIHGPVALSAHYGPPPGHPQVAIGLRRRDTQELVIHHFADHRQVTLASAVALPSAYLVTSQQARIRALLDAQGILYQTLEAPQPFRVIEQRFAATSGGTSGYLVRPHSATIDLKAPAGALLIESGQRRGRQAMLLLDPRSDSSLFRDPQFATLLGPEHPPPVYPVVDRLSGSLDVGDDPS